MNTKTVLTNIGALFPSLAVLMHTISLVVGIGIAIAGAWALVHERRYRSSGDSAWKGGLLSIAIGSVMAAMSSFLGAETVTVFGGGQQPLQMFQYHFSTNQTNKLIVHFILDSSAVLGWVWAIYGWYLVHRSGHAHKAQQDDMSRGLTRLSASLILCNLLLVTNTTAHLMGVSNPLSLT